MMISCGVLRDFSEVRSDSSEAFVDMFIMSIDDAEVLSITLPSVVRHLICRGILLAER
jgi:hypothetical protein